jgi:hypothetical protein
MCVEASFDAHPRKESQVSAHKSRARVVYRVQETKNGLKSRVLELCTGYMNQKWSPKIRKIYKFMQCCGSEIFISNPGTKFFYLLSWVKKAPDPGSGSATKNF